MLVAHLSDPHLRTDALAGGPAAGFHTALGRVLAIDPRPDCVVITGDLVQYGHPGACGQLRELLDRFPLPVHLVVGNHDDPDALREIFGGTAFLADGHSTHYVVDHEGFAVVVLDSRRSDGPGGLLGNEQLAWLERELTARSALPVFVCLHHPPVPVGIPFLDGMRLGDGDEFGAVIDRHRHVAGILTGHVHRVITVPFGRTTVSVAPSTFRQSSLTLRADRQIGYLAEPTAFLLHVGVDGRIVTHTVPVSDGAGLTGAF